MLSCRFLLLGVAVGFIAAAPGHAWNDFGHELVARVAWQELEPEVRGRVLALLRQAPEDSRMHCLDLSPRDRDTLASEAGDEDRGGGCDRFAYRLGDAESSEDADRILFERAAYWPDLARDLDKYNQPTWHYIGWTWRQGADGSAHDTDLPVAEPNAVSQLAELARSVADRSRRPDERAIHLAWIFHLVGDVHQPLHAASRVTDRRDEREGDRGGNGFGLDEWNRNLHAFWDGALDGPTWAGLRRRLVAELGGESGKPPTPERFRAAFFEARDREFEGLKDRVAAEIGSLHPMDDATRDDLESGDFETARASWLIPDFEAWARESNRIVRASVYPADLTRGEAPPASYVDLAYRISLERAALAGYRLADLLRGLFGADDAR